MHLCVARSENMRYQFFSLRDGIEMYKTSASFFLSELVDFFFSPFSIKKRFKFASKTFYSPFLSVFEQNVTLEREFIAEASWITLQVFVVDLKFINNNSPLEIHLEAVYDDRESFRCM